MGSVLAAVGSALPETILPLVAIAAGHASGKEIGIGAILGAPFMLSTLAMFVIGVSVLYFARGGRRSRDVRGDRRVLLQDLGYFLVMYTLAVVGGLYHPKWYKWTLAAILLVGYVIYVIRHFQSPAGKTEEAEATGEVRPLYLLRMVRRLQGRREEGQVAPPTWASVTQVIVSLVAMVGGARIFVIGVDRIATVFHVPPLALALLIAPVATVAHVLDPCLAPFDRPAELEREIGQQQFFLISLNFNAEGTADVRRDHANLPFGKTQDIGDTSSERVRVRRRRPTSAA